jgi:hypothetical protein
MQTKITCPSCGAANPAGKILCVACGKAMLAPPRPQASPQLVPQPQQPSQPTQQMPQPQPIPPSAPQTSAGMQPAQTTAYPQGGYGQPPAYGQAQAVTPIPVQYSLSPAQPATAVRTSRVGWAFWPLWALASAVGWAIGLPMGIALVQVISKPLLDSTLSTLGVSTLLDPTAYLSSLAQFVAITAVVLGAIVGLASGITGWLVLQWRAYRAASWPVASMVGWTVGLPITGLLFLYAGNGPNSMLSQAVTNNLLGNNSLGLGLLAAAVTGLISGALLGISQWLVLRKQSRRAGWWLLASPLAWAAALCMVALLAGLLVRGSYSPFTTGDSQANLLMMEALAGAIIGAAGGLTTGALLTWILK